MNRIRLSSQGGQARGPKIEVGNSFLSGASPQNGEEIQNLESLRSFLRLLYTAVDHYVAESERPNHKTAANGNGFKLKTIAELVDELLAVKRDDGLSERYLQTLRSHLKRFGNAFDGEIGSVTCREIESWLRKLRVGPRARNNMRGSIVTLFHFARKQGYLPKGQPTEAEELAKAKDRGGQIGILKPEQLAYLLERAPEKIALFFALGAFAGMRSSEILRLEWGDVNFERRFITVAPEKAKTATRGSSPLHPTCSFGSRVIAVEPDDYFLPGAMPTGRSPLLNAPKSHGRTMLYDTAMLPTGWLR
jgi:hypothetical protein